MSCVGEERVLLQGSGLIQEGLVDGGASCFLLLKIFIFTKTYAAL